MKYVITGGAGNISKPLTLALLKAGHDVIVIGRNAEHLKELTNAGAKAAIGSVDDVSFLTHVFAGADAVYTMVPPRMDITANWKQTIGQVGKNYTEAIKANNIKYVVNLSSVGAHLADGCGPVSGLHIVEQELNSLTGVNVKHLRPMFFYANLLANVGMIKHMNIIGNNFGGTNFKFALVDTNDIADAAFEELSKLNFTGSSVRYIASDEVTTDEIAKEIGTAIGNPELPWVTFSDEQAYGGMVQAGLTEEIAKNYAEMGHAISNGTMYADYWANHPSTLGKTKLKDFARVFATVYSQN
ncbi:MAG: NAD-dependent epimerase/dehydratase family protein [Sphingobacteriales bacterium]|nr:MAG: NAD-dependent epimerase/dehydratase family protein [Sphingobacteriales bacterium]